MLIVGNDFWQAICARTTTPTHCTDFHQFRLSRDRIRSIHFESVSAREENVPLHLSGDETLALHIVMSHSNATYMQPKWKITQSNKRRTEETVFAELISVIAKRLNSPKNVEHSFFVVVLFGNIKWENESVFVFGSSAICFSDWAKTLNTVIDCWGVLVWW